MNVCKRHWSTCNWVIPSDLMQEIRRYTCVTGNFILYLLRHFEVRTCYLRTHFQILLLHSCNSHQWQSYTLHQQMTQVILKSRGSMSEHGHVSSYVFDWAYCRNFDCETLNAFFFPIILSARPSTPVIILWPVISSTKLILTT